MSLNSPIFTRYSPIFYSLFTFNLPNIYHKFTDLHFFSTDLIYCSFLHYCESHNRRLRHFISFINEYTDTDGKRNIIRVQATENLEDPIDIDNDIQELAHFNGVLALNTFSSALIHSQLFEVPLKRQNYHLPTLSEFAAMSKHTNSFVCFHDEGL